MISVSHIHNFTGGNTMSRTIALLLLASCIVGCGGESGKGGGTPSNLSNPHLVEAKINAQRGGIVAVTDTSSALYGTRVEIPPGALANDTLISIDAAQVQQLPTPTRPTSIGPSGTTFATPASVDLTYDPGLIQSGDDPQNLIVMVQDANGNAEVYVDPVVNSSLRLATITTTHLSLFEVSFPWEYKLFRQQQRLIDGRPERYEMGVSIFTFIVTGGIVKEYHPIIANGPANVTASFGKGNAADFFTTNTGNVIFLHGLFSNPANFQFDDQGLPNDNDLLAFLKATPQIKNILHYQYQSGWPITFNAKVLTDLVIKNASPQCRFVIVAHSMGGLVARHAIEQLSLGQYVEKVITLGTPHEGAPKQKIVQRFPRISSFLSAITIPGIEDLLVGSTFLTNLNVGYPGKKSSSTEYYAFAGQENSTALDDSVVTTISATAGSLPLPSSQKRIVPNTDHNALHANARNNGVGVLVNAIIENRVNRPPTADAGVDQTIALSSTGTNNPTVTLTGSATDPDLDAITYAWTQTSGPNVTLTNANTTTTTFTPTQVGTYTFELAVSDTDKTGTDTVTITVNPPPFTNATVVLTDDTYIESTYTKQLNNYGGLDTLLAGLTGPNSIWTDQTFLRFEVQSAIPAGATILSATLTCTSTTQWSNGASINCYDANTTWSEYFLTWNSYYGTAFQGTPGTNIGRLTFAGTIGTFNATPYFQAQAATGIVAGTAFSFAFDQTISLASKERTPSTPSTLTITWK